MSKHRSSRFTVIIDFLGIFGYVPYDGTPAKLAMVLPATDNTKPSCGQAQDGKTLYRHRWFVEYDPRNLPSAKASRIPSKTRALWTLSDLPGNSKFRRLTFHAPGAPRFRQGKGLQYVPEMAEIAPNYCHMKPDYLGWNPGKEIGGQIFIHRGKLKKPVKKERRRWVLPQHLRAENGDASPYQRPFSHIVRLELKNVRQFRIDAWSQRADQPTESLRLRPTRRSRKVRLRICNLCDTNPLRWPNSEDAVIDEDFRWYYELVDNADEIENALMGLHLPVPYPSTAPNGQGQNCLGACYPPQDYPG